MSVSTGEFAIDANVILRFLLRDHPELSPKAKDIMDAVQTGDLVVFCDPVVLAEVVWVLKSFYKVSPKDISAMLEPIVLAEGFRVPDKDRYLYAIELYGMSISHFGDACACAAALEHCEGRLLSFDKGLNSVDGILRAEEP